MAASGQYSVCVCVCSYTVECACTVLYCIVCVCRCMCVHMCCQMSCTRSLAENGMEKVQFPVKDLVMAHDISKKPLLSLEVKCVSLRVSKCIMNDLIDN